VAAANGSKWGISWSLIKDPELAAFVWQHYGTISNLDDAVTSDFAPKDKKDIDCIVGELLPAIQQGNSPLQNLLKALNYCEGEWAERHSLSLPRA